MNAEIQEAHRKEVARIHEVAAFFGVKVDFGSPPSADECDRSSSPFGILTWVDGGVFKPWTDFSSLPGRIWIEHDPVAPTENTLRENESLPWASAALFHEVMHAIVGREESRCTVMERLLAPKILLPESFAVLWKSQPPLQEVWDSITEEGLPGFNQPETWLRWHKFNAEGERDRQAEDWARVLVSDSIPLLRQITGPTSREIGDDDPFEVQFEVSGFIPSV